MAVATGVAKTVVVYRAMNERSWYRFGSGSYGFASTPIFENVNYGWYMPHGFHTPAAWVGMFAQRYMHRYGATSEDFGRVSVAARDFAATNPAAFHGKPITLAEHQASRWICEPCACWTAARKRRCGGDGHHLRRARARSRQPAGADQGGAQGIGPASRS